MLCGWGGRGGPAHVHESLAERHTLTVRTRTHLTKHTCAREQPPTRLRGSQCAAQLSVTLSRLHPPHPSQINCLCTVHANTSVILTFPSWRSVQKPTSISVELYL